VTTTKIEQTQTIATDVKELRDKYKYVEELLNKTRGGIMAPTLNAFANLCKLELPKLDHNIRNVEEVALRYTTEEFEANLKNYEEAVHTVNTQLDFFIASFKNYDDLIGTQTMKK
jgi:hypothetical protein